MSIFNDTNGYRQIDNVNENRIVNTWRYMVDFSNYFNDITQNTNENLIYNVKNVSLPKYSMKVYKRFYRGSERTFPIRRVCDGTFTITFYGRKELVRELSILSSNHLVEAKNPSDELETYTKYNDLFVRKFGIDVDDRYIQIIQCGDVGEKSETKIYYEYIKPVLVSIEYNSLNVESNALIEVSCEFQYKDFRIRTDYNEVVKLKTTMYFDDYITRNSIDIKNVKIENKFTEGNVKVGELEEME